MVGRLTGVCFGVGVGVDVGVGGGVGVGVGVARIMVTVSFAAVMQPEVETIRTGIIPNRRAMPHAVRMLL